MIREPNNESRSAADYLPQKLNLSQLRRAAAECRGCDLYQYATQTVFGAGPRKAELMLVGEVPGDQEDQQGLPFVGPAGRLLDQAFEAVGLRRSDVYLTNAVKHFKWEQRGKRRLHKKPRQIEIVSCRPWLEAEIQLIKPKVIVCLGATAAQSLLGKDFRITRQRGQLVRSQWAPWTLATWHPSAILRAPDPADRDQMREVLIEDLRRAAEQIK
jgi:DNA polymerase